MIRGGAFYAIWDEGNQTWSTDEYDVPRLVDQELYRYVEQLPELETGRYSVKYMSSFKSQSWTTFKQFVRSISDLYVPLDRKLVFLGDTTTKDDHVTKSLPYKLQEGSTAAWDELLGVLYSPLERQKIEWAIGAIIAGDSKTIQKFLVFYGSAGTGKSTVLNIIERLFQGYVSTFEAKSLGSNNGSFSTAAFKHNPLVGIQHDGDLSRIEDNTKLNSIVAHEDILINEKFMTAFAMKVDTFLLMGTNRPVMITDARSGLSRRIIDVHPTGNRVSADQYTTLVSQIEFELGAIAHKCLTVYKGLGKSYYNAYRPVEMMAQTDYFFNFVAASYDIFVDQGGVTAAHAWSLFKEFCEEQKIDSKMPQFKFREELKNYFENFESRAKVGNEWVWGWYSNFDTKRFIQHDLVEDNSEVFSMNDTASILDEVLGDLPAQYGRTDDHGSEVPQRRWDRVTTTLKDLNTGDLHYVKIPPNHIVIDFDLKDANGEKSLELNLEAASKWAKTYAELSKSGKGVHLHYLWDGDTDLLSPIFDEGVEVKVFKGNSSLRRRLSKCNNTPIATLSGGLPLKEKKVLSEEVMKNERQLRHLIVKALHKEVHAFTKPNIDFIEHVMKEAYDSGMVYDVEDMKAEIIKFALEATHQSEASLDAIARMKFRSEAEIENEVEPTVGPAPIPTQTTQTLAFYDVEVYPNLFMIRYKLEGDNPLVTLMNPTPQQVAAFMRLRLVGFFCRNYDNHIIYAASLGYSIEALYKLSQDLVNNVKNSKFGAAFNVSYTDVYDYASEKMSLKHWQVKLGLPHMEMDIPWDEPVPEDRIADVEEYCGNDVLATEAVHNARQGDYKARLILAALSGLSPNDTNNSHSAAIVFGKNRRPQTAFKYTKLAEMFPGYKFELGRSHYRDEIAGEGGYVYSEPGVYEMIELYDVASMHPTSIIELNLFGDEYTAKFKRLMDIRIALKRGEIDKALELDPRIENFVTIPHEGYDLNGAKLLADALKIVINSVYGLTSAKFDNPFRDQRNKDNIVAKRGALFMIDLKHVLQEAGYQVVHIKTDSVKVVRKKDEDPQIVKDLIMRYGEKYGYTFEHEATYDKFCLFNDAVYVAREHGVWHAKGKQMLDPYTFKMLFTGDEIEFEDFFEQRSIQKGTMYLEFNTELDVKNGYVPGDTGRFIGRTGVFVPVREGTGGGILYRVIDGKATAIPDTKGYLWKETAVASRDDIDLTFFDKKLDKARAAIDELGGYEELMK